MCNISLISPKSILILKQILTFLDSFPLSNHSFDFLHHFDYERLVNGKTVEHEMRTKNIDELLQVFTSVTGVPDKVGYILIFLVASYSNHWEPKKPSGILYLPALCSSTLLYPNLLFCISFPSNSIFWKIFLSFIQNSSWNSLCNSYQVSSLTSLKHDFFLHLNYCSE